MTLPAFETWEIRGLEGPRYSVGPNCSNPTCQRRAEHAHHIVRRSQLGGDYAWISVEGETLANLTGLCVPCHEDITGRIGGHKAAIRYRDGLFVWCTVERGHDRELVLPGLPLRPQPPTPESLAERAPEAAESEPCPFCGRTGEQHRRRRPASARVGRRRRKSWGLVVPDDDEDGATVLDTLVEALAPVLNIEPSLNGRYYVVVPALVYSLQNIADFAKSVRGAG